MFCVPFAPAMSSMTAVGSGGVHAIASLPPPEDPLPLLDPPPLLEPPSLSLATTPASPPPSDPLAGAAELKQP